MTKPGQIATNPLIPICDRLAGVLRVLEMVRGHEEPHEPDVLLMLEDIIADQINNLQDLAQRREAPAAGAPG